MATKTNERLYYKIGEACKLLDIQPYVLRYWETEFPELAPGKSKSGQRVYSAREIKIIRRIKQLLYEEGYTIAGAKKKLGGESEGAESVAAVRAPATGPRAEPEKVEALRRGIASALSDARGILRLLSSEDSS